MLLAHQVAHLLETELLFLGQRRHLALDDLRIGTAPLGMKGKRAPDELPLLRVGLRLLHLEPRLGNQ